MCGIAGIINHRDQYNESEILNAMCGTMYHRGPDGGGIFAAPGVLLGHRRLAVIDLESGDQPLYSEDRSLALVINGEIYNFASLRRELESKGHTFATSSDSEVLLHLYEESPDTFINRLEGMFAFALWDSKKQRLILGRDRMGKKPLYYFIKKGSLVFGSELEVLKCHPDCPGTLDPEALADYFSLLYVPQPYTVYKEIYALPAAHYMIFECAAGKGTLHPYWQLDLSKKHTAPRAEIAEELRRLVTEAVRKRLVSDVPTGVFLSGGIDSNIVTGLAAELLQGNSCRAYTVGFRESRYDERALARIGAAFINGRSGGNLICKEREVDIPDFSLVEELTAHCGQPYADSSILPTALLSAFAREEITVALSGDGADELFGGYERYLAMAMAAKLEKLPRFFRRSMLQGISLFPDRGERSFSGRLRRFLRISCTEEKNRYFAILDRAPETLRRKLFSQEFYSQLCSSGAERFRRNAGTLTTRDRGEIFSEMDLHTYLPGDILPKADISSMANSLEVRSPFLDREVVEFASRIPWEMKLCGKERKSILKEAFGHLLAPEIRSAPKKGFGVPVASLLRNRWYNSAEELLFSEKLLQSGFLNPETLKTLWRQHQSGKLDHSYILWSIIIFALFLKNAVPDKGR
ncbi:MAG: asparagine synthase (glutamine-hydrolyzing) [Lentisphaerae bacterium]|nr:asparagine synthase (glutamine-hydrolyzing) [Lentisphaerota bacterium]